MAKRNRDEEEEVKPKKEGFDFKAFLPKLMKFGLVGVDVLIMLAAAYTIYDIKIAYRRPAMTEETETLALDQERMNKDTRAVMLTVDPFVANLDGFPHKTLRTSIHLEMLNETGFEEAMEIRPQARDTIIKILGAKGFGDVESIQGKLFLKNEIMTALNHMLTKGTVKDVYFGEFLVQ